MEKKGFTLIELMVALVIIGILASVVIPSYLDYISRARLTEAFDALAIYHVKLEQAYQDSGSYANSTAGCVVGTPSTAHFNYSCQLANSGQGYLITATANGANSLAGYKYTIDQSGAKSTVSFPNANGLPKSCWLAQIGDC